MRSALHVVFGFFLGFLANLTEIPQYMDVSTLMVSPASANISAQLSQMMPDSFIKVKLSFYIIDCLMSLTEKNL